MKKRILLLIGGLSALGLIIWGGIQIRIEHYPVEVNPSPE